MHGRMSGSAAVERRGNRPGRVASLTRRHAGRKEVVSAPGMGPVLCFVYLVIAVKKYGIIIEYFIHLCRFCCMACKNLARKEYNIGARQQEGEKGNAPRPCQVFHGSLGRLPVLAAPGGLLYWAILRIAAL